MAPRDCTMTPRGLRNILLLYMLGGSISGCGRADWNWDASWWRTPRPVTKTAPSRKAGQHPRTEEPRRRTSEPRCADAVSPKANIEAKHVGPSADGAPAAPKRRPYYQLYLISDAPAAAGPQAAPRLHLQHATARSCAAMLEMLYVPLGRSGSREECYLIYEQRAEFEAAKALVPLLDVERDDETASSKDAEAALSRGVGMMLSIIQKSADAGRAAVKRVDIDRCERLLAEAGKSSELPARRRWIAAILAGRLLSAYRYDHAGARRYFDQAKKQTSEDSIEEMAAQWWRADTFAAEGNRDRADAIYRRILSDYRDVWPDSAIVARSKAILKKHRKR